MNMHIKKKPNLFIVGEPKSGTTALYHFLRQHPEVYIPEQKELHHFAKDLNRERLNFHKKISSYFNYSLEEYLRHYEKVKDEKIIGDMTPTYLFSKLAAKAIFTHNPESKIIALFREPVDYLYSQHAQFLYGLAENEIDFCKALELEKGRKAGKKIPKNIREPSMLHYSEKVMYANHLKRFLEVFPPNQIKVIIYKDFQRDNAKVYKEIMEFLSIDSNFRPEFKKHNPNEKVRLKFIRQVALSPFVSSISKKIFPKHIFNSIKKTVIKTTTKQEERKPLEQDIVLKLKKRYKPEVCKLNDLLHKYNLLDKNTDLIKVWQYENV